MKVGSLVRHKGCLGIVIHHEIPKHGWHNGVRTSSYVEWITECKLKSKNWSEYDLEVVSE